MAQETHDKIQGHKIVVLVGPTASGKTACAVTLAKHLSGEIISADSRQVYRGLDIGTDKITPTDMRGIPHHLIDIVEPDHAYSAADFISDADHAIADIVARDKLPIIAGGTFFYIDALLGRRSLARVPANPELRAYLESQTTDALCAQLQNHAPHLPTQIDIKNRRRLIRALEILATQENIPAPVTEERYDACIIGLTISPEDLEKRINARLDATLARGLVEETQHLLARGISASRLNEIGLEYRIVVAYLSGTYTYEEMRTLLKQKVRQYAKRQRTWLKKMPDVRWVPYDAPQKAIDIATQFCGR